MPVIVGNTTVNTAITSNTASVNVPQGFAVYNATRNTVLPTLRLDFVNSNVLDPRVTFARSTSATYFNSAGVLTTAPANTPRFDYDPATGICNGLLIEEFRINSIRNNTMVGAVAGTPGTLPTNWASTNGSTNSGVTLSVVGTGQENGISYIDVGISGTATATSNQLNIALETNSGIAASSGQVWSFSGFSKIVTGSLNNIGIYFQFGELNSSGDYLQGGTLQLQPSISSLATQKSSASYTIANASTAFIRPLIYFVITNGQTYNFTLRIGLPQLEQGAFATSAIATAGATATRATDTISLIGTNFSSWYNSTNWTTIVSAVPAKIPNQSATLSQSIFEFRVNGGNRILTRINPGSSVITSYWINTLSQPSNSGGYNSSALTSNTAFKYGMTASNGSWNLALNGSIFISGVGGYLITPTELWIGSSPSDFLGFTGWIQRISYYPVVVSNNELISLTS